MLNQRNLLDLFKATFANPIVEMVWPGVVGCMACRDRLPWAEYACECSHHRNKRQSKMWNESRVTMEPK